MLYNNLVYGGYMKKDEEILGYLQLPKLIKFKEEVSKNLDEKINVNKALVFGYFEFFKYYKWLTYQTKEQMSVVTKFFDTGYDSLTLEEKEVLHKIEETAKIINIFDKVLKNNYTRGEYGIICNLMVNNKLSSLIRSKSSEEELEKANLIVEEISKLSLNDIEEFMNESKLRYKELSISEAYALVVLEEKYNHRIMRSRLYEARDKIEVEKKSLRGAYYKTMDEAGKRFVK